jgi:hypothetical protein
MPTIDATRPGRAALISGIRGNPRKRAASCVTASLLRALMVLTVLLAPASAPTRVLEPADVEKIGQIKDLFLSTMANLTEVSRRPDLASTDSSCIRSTIQELIQISQELSAYEYLITIEDQITDFGDDKTMKDILRFAVEKAIAILATERSRLTQLGDQCSRFPLSSSKTQLAIKFIDTTSAVLSSLQPRL